LSEEIEYRLEQSLHKGDAESAVFGGEVSLKLMRALAGFASATSELRGKNWLREPSVFDEVIRQWNAALAQLRPGIISIGGLPLQWNLPDFVSQTPGAEGAVDVLKRLIEELTDKTRRAAVKEAFERHHPEK
jgi:hypothetical protein